MTERDRRRRADGRAGRASDSTRALDDLVVAAVQAWRTDATAHRRAVERLAASGDDGLDAVVRRVDEALTWTWAHGWTPLDVVHVVARALSRDHAATAAAMVLADNRARAAAGQRLHPRWEDQLAALAARTGDAPGGAAAVPAALDVLCLLHRLPELPVTVPPPGASAAGGASGLDERVLERVRALLAKAESTEFEHEAESLTAKAQELIARNAIDAALLSSDREVGDPSVRRIPLADPYAGAKSVLLAEIGRANRCRVVYSADLGWVTAFGYDGDLDALELLGASLLAQATGAMARHGPRRDAFGRSTTRSFRRSFLLGFAHRIGQRLRAATDGQVAGAAAEQDRLLPVLAARDSRLRAAEAAVFPRVLRRASAASNGAGWVAGKAAADLASLDVTAGRLGDAPP